MNHELLLDHFGRIADAPDAVPRMRRLILDLAVRGKLVPQHAGDEMAPELRDQIEKHKSKVSQDDLPRGWGRLPLGAVVVFQYGKGMTKSERAERGPVTVYGSNGPVGYTDTPLTTRPAIIVGRKGSAGALNLCLGPSWTTDVAFYVESPQFIDIHFLVLALRSMDLDRLARGVKPGLSRSAAYKKLIRVPPLHEQRRIVATVDEMTVICDELEKRMAERAELRSRLFAALVSEVAAPD